MSTGLRNLVAVALSASVLGCQTGFRAGSAGTDTITTADFGGMRSGDRVVTSVKLYDSGVTPPPGASYVDQYGEDQDVAVAIGNGAKAAITDASTASTGDTLRSVSVAIGGKADAQVDGKASQAIAIGFHSQAKASNAIAIGSGAEHPAETWETGDATVARGSQSVAVGYGAKATGTMSMQLGKGRNDEPSSLKFGDTYIVRGGRLAVEIPTNDVEEAYAASMRPVVVTDTSVDEVSLLPAGTASLMYTNAVPYEFYVKPRGPRNYKVYIPNSQAMREVLPVSFDSEGDFAKAGTGWTDKVVCLPAFVDVNEPVPGTVYVGTEYVPVDDGYSWEPAVTNVVSESGSVTLYGTNLHSVVSARFDGSDVVPRNPRFGTVAFNVVSGFSGEVVGTWTSVSNGVKSLRSFSFTVP